jgi:hypothetical protein
MDHAAKNNSDISQLAVNLSRVAAFVLLKKESGTLTVISFRDVYENSLLVQSKSSPITSALRNPIAPRLLCSSICPGPHSGVSSPRGSV